MADAVQLCTEAWLLVGLSRTCPGVLEMAGGRLTFHAEDGPVFDAPLADVGGVVFPWYYFGGGMKLRVGGEKHRISFVRPNGAEYVAGQVLARMGNPLGLLVAGQKLVDIGTGRRAGKAWREAFSALA